MPPATQTRELTTVWHLELRTPKFLAAWALGCFLPAYVALEGGGYDAVLRGEVGIAVWWLLIVGTLAGALPLARWSRGAWFGVAMFTAFTAWSALAITWSPSSERSLSEVARLATYLGVFLLALSLVRTQGACRQAVAGLACGTAGIAILALVSRLHPAWFPANVTAQFLPGTQSRLSYPLNYWNALAAFVALGVPAMLATAYSARRVFVHAILVAAVPALAGAMFLSGSRGGALAVAAGVVVYAVIGPRKAYTLATLANISAGAGIVIASIADRAALDSGLATSLAHRQGTQVFGTVAVVCAGVALVQTGIALAERHAALGSSPRLARKSGLLALGAGALAVVGLFIAVHGPHSIAQHWVAFKNPNLGLSVSAHNSFQRFGVVSGNGRYQLWQTALHANESRPLTGIGPGTFEFWWAQHSPFFSFARNAHSLFFETLAEVGIFGLALLLAFLGAVMTSGLSRVRRAADANSAVLAAAVAGSVSFIVSAGVDWVWQVPAIPIAFLVLAAVLVAAPTSRSAARPRVALRLAAVGLSMAAVLAIGVSLLSTADVRQSQTQAVAGRYGPALSKARSAHKIQPGAASPLLQQALVLEARRDFRAAIAAATQATRTQSGDWRSWVVLSRVAAENGQVDASIAAYRRARALNPKSPLFAHA